MAGYIIKNGKKTGFKSNDLRGQDFTNAEFHQSSWGRKNNANFKRAVFLYAHVLGADFTYLTPDGLDGSHFSLNRRGILTAKFNKNALTQNIDFDYNSQKVVGVKVDQATGYLTCDINDKLLELLVNDPAALDKKLGVNAGATKEIPAIEVFMEQMASALQNGIKIYGKNKTEECAEIPHDHPLRYWAVKYVHMLQAKGRGKEIKDVPDTSAQDAQLAHAIAVGGDETLKTVVAEPSLVS